MELNEGTHEFAEEDIISNMPENVITNILDRLPLQDAVRTDVLARHWRFKWTLLSQLVFDDNFFEHLSKTEDKNNHVRIISRILLHVRGPITKFVLLIDEHGCSVLNVEDISHWILFLSRKGIKDLTIRTSNVPLLKLPTHLFSCVELTHLELCMCCFYPPTAFNGFPNLLSLDLSLVEFERWEFGEFVLRCPVLENLKVQLFGATKLDDIAKLTNLKTLSLVLANTEKMTVTSSTSGSCYNYISELLCFLPKLQELELDFIWWNLTETEAKQRFATTFPRLKTLKLSSIGLRDGIMLPYAFETIKSFPNLQTLEIIDGPTPPICSSEADYNTVELLQLRSVVFVYCSGSENEVCLVKFILACSPLLKKIVIRPYSSLEKTVVRRRRSLESDEKFMFAKKLLKLHRASSTVDIDLY